jgi:hypothetical protein
LLERAKRNTTGEASEMRFFLKLAPRCSVLLLLLLVTASRGLNIGDLLGSTPAVRTSVELADQV